MDRGELGLAVAIPASCSVEVTIVVTAAAGLPNYDCDPVEELPPIRRGTCSNDGQSAIWDTLVFLPGPRNYACDVRRVDPSRFQSSTRRNRFEEDQMRVVLAAVLTTDSNAVDIGAHGGTVLRELMRCAPLGSHVAYEPLPDHAERLARLFPTVDVRQVALAHEEGEANFVHVTTLSPWSGLRRRLYPPSVSEEDLEEFTVQVEVLDRSLPEGYVPNLIKIDVEGAEEWVLRGALQVLRTHKPTVIFEHSLTACDAFGTSSASLYQFICEEAGFRIFDLAGDGPYTLSEFQESQWHSKCLNYLAQP
jgi:FkbM family methyltransferase